MTEPTGRVLQVSVSPGGVPKLAVERAWVGELGLEGDKHHDFTVHGGPHRAVCLIGIEVIERLQSEGHPVEPGSVGENLTTRGIEWSLLPVGTRARVGNEVELEIASSTGPCTTQTHNFTDGKFSRINIDLHPSDSRMYARVLRQGEVKPGDSITILPPLPDSRATDELRLNQLDRLSAKANGASWRAAVRSGFDIDIVEDGEIAMASARDIHGPAFNHANGLARLPNLVSMATDFYDSHGRVGWLWTEAPPWPGALPTQTTTFFAADPRHVPDGTGPTGLTIGIIGPADAGTFVGLYDNQMAASGVSEHGPNPWPQVFEKLADWPHRWLFLAKLNGKPVGAASLHTHNKAGWLRGGVVIQEARGQGIQRALIAARAQKALSLGCDLVGSQAETEGPSATNLQRMGLRPIGQRNQYKYVPATATATK